MPRHDPGRRSRLRRVPGTGPDPRRTHGPAAGRVAGARRRPPTCPRCGIVRWRYDLRVVEGRTGSLTAPDGDGPLEHASAAHLTLRTATFTCTACGVLLGSGDVGWRAVDAALRAAGPRSCGS